MRGGVWCPLALLSSLDASSMPERCWGGEMPQPFFPPGCAFRETVHWLATEPDRDGLITDLMSSLAVGTDMHHVHLCDIAWVCLLALFRYRFKLGKSAK
ncbi:hypothetical protein PIB30_006626 [Stylosanthes scabra]|uniref:Secreted protein n=1 Tax=Stylosanthes scabra TaxID=79078 RepID=A0ABU6Q4E5_9FABA|nr:hypothetical protein [Stylosanthes scabra]